jgi:MOSC domain-containing protein YiiM
MHYSALHLTMLELEQGLADILASPRDSGRLDAIFVRPASNERRALSEAQLTTASGFEGDRWVHDSYYRTPDAAADPRSQISIMNARILRQISGSEDAMCLAGDNLIVDFDLSDGNLSPGNLLAIGSEVIVEITDLAHNGCGKLASRYGNDARTFINNKRGRELHLRGRYAQVVRGGTIHVGDTVCKQPVS